MKILALSALYPPHHAGTYDTHCESIVNALRLRGHEVLVLTSNHGLKGEQEDGETARRLHLQGAHGHPPVTKYFDLKQIELHNHAVLHEVIQRFQPDVVHVHSLDGLSKSLVYGLRNARVPVAYDVADDWVCTGIAADAWLRYWNAPALSFLEQSTRKGLELSGERGRLDDSAPTRMMRGYDRLPMLYGNKEETSAVQPNSIAAFRFDRIYFTSYSLKGRTERAGFNVLHGDVIYPGIRAEAYVQEVRSATAPVERFLVVSNLDKTSGVLTALQAIKLARQSGRKAQLSIYGRGDSSYIAEVRSFAVTNSVPVEFLTVSNLVKDMPSVFRKHDAFIYSAEWDEPFPLTTLEAMATGLPVISTNKGGASEVIRHGENGLTFEAGDPADLAGRMYELQIQPNLRVQMAETGQQEILSRYNETSYIDRIESYLNGTLEVWGLGVV
jgi:glycogen(starch) synthase